MKIKNAKNPPAVYYGLHFAPGVAEYRQPGKDAFRIFINENTAKAMDKSFRGKPVYVRHVDEVNLDRLQEEADGYVFESFYNALDGKHWVKFVVVSDEAHECIRRGWRLSNAYEAKSFGDGGLWHGVDYDKEVLSGEYEHLAIVDDPRYDESVIFTPEQFKQYNESKEHELKKLANSKQESNPMKFNIFKRTKVENTKDVNLEELSVVLPKSGKEMTLTELVNEMDKVQNMHGYANGDHMVKVGEEEMSVNDLVKKHMAMCNEAAEKAKAELENEEDESEGEELENEDVEADKKPEDLGEEKDEKLHPKNSAEEKAKKKEVFDRVKNASRRGAEDDEAPKIDLPMDKVARGKQRYGSGN